MYVCKHIIIFCAGKPVVKITTTIGGCEYVYVSWNVSGNNDECSLSSFNVTLSYMSKDIKSVTSFMITTFNSSTFTGLPDNTQVNITVSGIKREDVLSFDSTSVMTKEFESMCVMCKFPAY